jgi:CheY-like chemotaxis protein
MSNNRKTILVIDDDSDYRQIIVDRLVNGGFTTLEAVNGEVRRLCPENTRRIQDIKNPYGVLMIY